MSIGPALLTVVGEPLLSVSCVSCVFASTRVTAALSPVCGTARCFQFGAVVPSVLRERSFKRRSIGRCSARYRFLPCLLARFSETKSPHFMSPVCGSSRGVAGVRCTQHRDLQAVADSSGRLVGAKTGSCASIATSAPSEQPASGRRPGGLGELCLLLVCAVPVLFTLRL